MANPLTGNNHRVLPARMAAAVAALRHQPIGGWRAPDG
jgi:hypothetical protein